MTGGATSARFPRLVRWLRDALLVGGITLGLIVLAEATLRLFFPQHEVGTAIRGEHLSVEDPLLGYRYEPCAHWNIRHPEYHVEYEINCTGYRDAQDHAVPKPEGTTRVLVLGDSFTFGQGVNYEDTWLVMSERELARRGRSHIQLVKAGVQGMDQRGELILMKRLVDRFDIDAVVVVFLINDLYTNLPLEPSLAEAGAVDAVSGDAASSATAGEWEALRKQVFVRRNPFRELHLLTLAKRMLTATDAMYTRLYVREPGRGDFLSPPLHAEAQRKLRITEGLFEQMADYADSVGVRLTVLSIPQQFQILYDKQSQSDASIDVGLYDRHFRALLERRGIAWVTSLDELAAEYESSRTPLFFRLDGHLTPAGNQIVADVFLDRVVPLVAGARRREAAND